MQEIKVLIYTKHQHKTTINNYLNNKHLNNKHYGKDIFYLR